MTLIYRYKKVKRPDGTGVKTPSIPITISGVEKFETLALLDSGADISAMPKDMAEILGLDMKRGVTAAFGIGGKVNSIETKARIAIGKGHEFYNLEVPIKVILGSYDFPVILGRAGFFDKFVISFHQSKEKVLLKKENMQ